MVNTILQIRPNRYQLFGKLLVLALLGGVLWLVRVSPKPVGSTIPEICFLIFIIILIIIIFIQLLYLVTGVAIDEESRTIQIKFLLRPDKIFLLNDIESYSTTTVYTKSDIYECILLKTKEGGKILLGDCNLNDYTPIKKFLEESKVECTGAEKFKFFSYYWNAK